MNKESPRFLSRSQVVARVGLGRHTIARMEEKETFPGSFINGRVRRFYIESEIEDWMQCQLSGRKWTRPLRTTRPNPKK